MSPIDLSVQSLETRLATTTAVNAKLSATFRIPTAVMWNRLEGRPRSPDLARALRAEVRDPLWMLARQWQMGEFEGEDSGVPIDARLETESRPLTSVSLRGATSNEYQSRCPSAYWSATSVVWTPSTASVATEN